MRLDVITFSSFVVHTNDDDEQEEVVVTLLPLWILLGLLALLALLYWCCWRPGWFPWRVCRLRNVKCGSR